MSHKLSRRDMLKLTAAGAAAVGAGIVPQLKAFAAPPRQGTVTLSFQENESDYTKVVQAFSQKFPSLPNPVSNRNHCVTWSDWLILTAVPPFTEYGAAVE